MRGNSNVKLVASSVSARGELRFFEDILDRNGRCKYEIEQKVASPLDVRYFSARLSKVEGSEMETWRENE